MTGQVIQALCLWRSLLAGTLLLYNLIVQDAAANFACFYPFELQKQHFSLLDRLIILLPGFKDPFPEGSALNQKQYTSQNVLYDY
jgi:hypothetical protein